MFVCVLQKLPWRAAGCLETPLNKVRGRRGRGRGRQLSCPKLIVLLLFLQPGHRSGEQSSYTFLFFLMISSVSPNFLISTLRPHPRAALLTQIHALVNILSICYCMFHHYAYAGSSPPPPSFSLFFLLL